MHILILKLDFLNLNKEKKRPKNISKVENIKKERKYKTQKLQKTCSQGSAANQLTKSQSPNLLR